MPSDPTSIVPSCSDMELSKQLSSLLYGGGSGAGPAAEDRQNWMSDDNALE